MEARKIKYHPKPISKVITITPTQPTIIRLIRILHLSLHITWRSMISWTILSSIKCNWVNNTVNSPGITIITTARSTTTTIIIMVSILRPWTNATRYQCHKEISKSTIIITIILFSMKRNPISFLIKCKSIKINNMISNVKHFLAI